MKQIMLRINSKKEFPFQAKISNKSVPLNHKPEKFREGRGVRELRKIRNEQRTVANLHNQHKLESKDRLMHFSQNLLSM